MVLPPDNYHAAPRDSDQRRSCSVRRKVRLSRACRGEPVEGEAAPTGRAYRSERRTDRSGVAAGGSCIMRAMDPRSVGHDRGRARQALSERGGRVGAELYSKTGTIRLQETLPRRVTFSHHGGPAARGCGQGTGRGYRGRGHLVSPGKAVTDAEDFSDPFSRP